MYEDASVYKLRQVLELKIAQLGESEAALYVAAQRALDDWSDAGQPGELPDAVRSLTEVDWAEILRPLAGNAPAAPNAAEPEDWPLDDIAPLPEASSLRPAPSEGMERPLPEPEVHPQLRAALEEIVGRQLAQQAVLGRSREGGAEENRQQAIRYWTEVEADIRSLRQRRSQSANDQARHLLDAAEKLVGEEDSERQNWIARIRAELSDELRTLQLDAMRQVEQEQLQTQFDQLQERLRQAATKADASTVEKALSELAFEADEKELYDLASQIDG